MPGASYVYTDFRGGFWSASSQGRMDDPEYKRALNECYNGYPIEQGPWVRRPAFRAIGYTRFGQEAKLISLSGATKNYYNMEVSSGHLRFIHGAQFITDATQQKVTNISTDNPLVVTTESEHGWSSDDTVIFTIKDPDTALLYSPLMQRVLRIIVTSTTTFQLHDLLTGAGVSGAAFAWSNGLEVYISRITDIATPYYNDTWKGMKRLQTDKNVLLLHVAFPPQVLTYTEASGDTWLQPALNPAKFKDGPYLDPQKNSTTIPTGLDGIVSLEFTYTPWDAGRAYDTDDKVRSGGFHWKSMKDENINQTPTDGSEWWERTSSLSWLPKKSLLETDVGRHVRLYSEPPDWTEDGSYGDGDKVKFNDAYWMAITSVTGPGSNQPGADATKWVPYPAGARWTWGKIVSLGVGDKIEKTGTIGNLTEGPGLAALFDGHKINNDKQCARRTALNAFGGIQMAATEVTGCQVWAGRNLTISASGGSSTHTQFNQNAGFFGTSSIVTVPGPASAGNSVGAFTFVLGKTASVTINLRAKNSAPANATDGTLLGTSGPLAAKDVNAAPVHITSTDATTQWTYVWAEIVVNSFGQLGPTTVSVVASEMEFYSNGVSGNTVGVQIMGDPLLYESEIRVWRLGRYNDTDPVYPSCGCFHEGRIWLASGKNHFDASAAKGDIFNFAPTESDGTVTDANGISYTFNSEVNAETQWMHPGDEGIILGLAGGERLIFSTTSNEAITPTNANVELRTSYGSADIEPVQAPITSLFVHANGRDIHEYMRDASSGRFVAPPLTEYSKSLSKGGIVQIAYQRALTSIIWAVTADGKLIGTSYERSYLPFRSESPPDYNGWHHHDHGAPRDFVSVSVGPSVSGSPVEALSVITLDRGTQFYRIECAVDLMPEDNDIFDCNFLDGMLVPSSGGSSLIPSDDPDIAPPDPDPPKPPPSDPFGCEGNFPDFYRTEVDESDPVNRALTPLSTHDNGSGDLCAILYGPFATGSYITFGNNAHVGQTVYIDLAGFPIPNQSTGVTVVGKIIGLVGTDVAKVKVLERWLACEGSVNNWPEWPELG